MRTHWFQMQNTSAHVHPTWICLWRLTWLRRSLWRIGLSKEPQQKGPLSRQHYRFVVTTNFVTNTQYTQCTYAHKHTHMHTCIAQLNEHIRWQFTTLFVKYLLFILSFLFYFYVVTVSHCCGLSKFASVTNLTF